MKWFKWDQKIFLSKELCEIRKQIDKLKYSICGHVSELCVKKHFFSSGYVFNQSIIHFPKEYNKQTWFWG